MDRTFHPSFSLKFFDGQSVSDIPITKLTGEVFELADEIGQMVQAVRGHGPFCTTGEDGLWSVKMCLKAQESVSRGCVVSF